MANPTPEEVIAGKIVSAMRDQKRFQFLRERFAAMKTSASKRWLYELRLEEADPADDLATIIDQAQGGKLDR